MERKKELAGKDIKVGGHQLINLASFLAPSSSAADKVHTRPMLVSLLLVYPLNCSLSPSHIHNSRATRSGSGAARNKFSG